MSNGTTAPMQFPDWNPEPAGHSLTTVLVAVGGSGDQTTVVKLGAAVARDYGARVCVVHATERQVSGRASFDLETPEEAREIVENAMSDVRRQGVATSGYIVLTSVGHVPDAILQKAADVGADEIIVGAKSHGGRLLRGKAERLLRRSPYSWLLAPASEVDAERSRRSSVSALGPIQRSPLTGLPSLG
jgi:nucleotide-binding universal stress UspA family protein